MKNLTSMRKTLGLALVSAGLMALPVTAHADAASEITTAATHAGFAAKSGTIQMVHTHMHHALNCLVGPNGNGFDSSALNPCKNNGNGAIPDTADATKKQKLEGVAASLRKGLKDNNLGAAQKTASNAESTLKSVK